MDSATLARSTSTKRKRVSALSPDTLARASCLYSRRSAAKWRCRTKHVAKAAAGYDAPCPWSDVRVIRLEANLFSREAAARTQPGALDRESRERSISPGKTTQEVPRSSDQPTIPAAVCRDRNRPRQIPASANRRAVGYVCTRPLCWSSRKPRAAQTLVGLACVRPGLFSGRRSAAEGTQGRNIKTRKRGCIAIRLARASGSCIRPRARCSR